MIDHPADRSPASTRTLEITHDNALALDAIAWPTVAGLAIDRTAVETWSDYVTDSQPAEGATLLESGHLFTAVALYADGNLDVVGWCESYEDIRVLAFNIAAEHDLPVTYNPALIRHFRTQLD